MLTALGSKEAEMRIIGCDVHTAKQTMAMLDRDTGEVIEHTLNHEGETVRAFYASLPKPTVVGIEATGSMGWFVGLMEELGITCHVGHPAAIRTAEPRVGFLTENGDSIVTEDGDRLGFTISFPTTSSIGALKRS
jgi:hypothetical protein